MKSREVNDLALRLRKGDISAFNSLYWEYHGAVYANALKLIKDQPIAEDIVQEVFVALWEKRYSIDPKQDITGWLFVVCHHKTIDQLKRKLRHALAEKILQAVIEAPQAVEEDITEEQIGAIEKAVDQLSPQKRKVFELCKLQRRTYEKAAEELQISKYTVKEYLSDAMMSIKKYIVQHPTHANALIYFFALTGILLNNNI
ncbi:MAG TPA: sigma-70 family RNA polymerase sigma factor [Chitinophagaceae bacterium]|nr:sigma-70 family RNA polymerase sigma factor [Chitinophagaceae bacterium]